MKKIQGILPALVTPLCEDETLNVPVLHQLINDQLAGGANGFYVGGATGEGIALRREVREELGLEIADGQIRNCVRTFNGHKIVDIYLVYTEAEIEDMVLQEEEVEQVCWVSGRELLSRFGGKNTRLHEEYVSCMQRYVHVTHKAEKRRRRRQNAKLAQQGSQG